MSYDKRTTPMPTAGSTDPMGDALSRLFGFALAIAAALVALPLLLPLAASRLAGDMVATKTRFWIVWRWQWALNKQVSSQSPPWLRSRSSS